MRQPSANVERLARRLKEDICRRRLAPHDRYMTSLEVGRLFDVSEVTAHRAMSLLADEDILIRQRKAGTFVGEGIRSQKLTRRKIHFVASYDVGRDQSEVIEAISSDMFAGLLDVSPDVSVQIDIVRPEDSEPIVQSIIDSASAEGNFDGAVLLRSTALVQRLFAESGLPVVILGSAHRGVTNLVSLDVDHHRIGELTAQYLIESGRQRASLLMQAHWNPGDDTFMSGFTYGLQKADGRVEMSVLSLRPDEQVIDEAIRGILESMEGPEMLIARDKMFARRAVEVARQMGMTIPERVDVVIGNHHEFRLDGRSVPGGRCLETNRQCGQLLGRLLKSLRENEMITDRQVVLPVEFRG